MNLKVNKHYSNKKKRLQNLYKTSMLIITNKKENKSQSLNYSPQYRKNKLIYSNASVGGDTWQDIENRIILK